MPCPSSARAALPSAQQWRRGSLVFEGFASSEHRRGPQILERRILGYERSLSRRVRWRPTPMRSKRVAGQSRSAGWTAWCSAPITVRSLTELKSMCRSSKTYSRARLSANWCSGRPVIKSLAWAWSIQRLDLPSKSLVFRGGSWAGVTLGMRRLSAGSASGDPVRHLAHSTTGIDMPFSPSTTLGK